MRFYGEQQDSPVCVYMMNSRVHLCAVYDEQQGSPVRFMMNSRVHLCVL
jgi:hypothetical protein